jgi:hypothetical protein
VQARAHQANGALSSSAGSRIARADLDYLPCDHFYEGIGGVVVNQIHRTQSLVEGSGRAISVASEC